MPPPNAGQKRNTHGDVIVAFPGALLEVDRRTRVPAAQWALWAASSKLRGSSPGNVSVNRGR